jgi:hypothetical protein
MHGWEDLRMHEDVDDCSNPVLPVMTGEHGDALDDDCEDGPRQSAPNAYPPPEGNVAEFKR